MTDESLLTLFDAATSIATNTRPEKVAILARNICTVDLNNVSARSLAWDGDASSTQLLGSFLDAWRACGIHAEQAAGILVGASRMYIHMTESQSIDLVWTGPSSNIIPTRQTEQVLLQVIRRARTKIFLTSFVAYDVMTIVDALIGATERGVNVSILLESSDEHGGSLSVDSIGKIRDLIPSARVLHWSNKEARYSGGKVHAKVVVADGFECFISSANLTNHAMEKNMEAGVLVTGGGVPRDLHEHLDALVTMNVLS